MRRTKMMKIAKLVRDIAEEMVHHGDVGDNNVSPVDLAGGCGDVSAVFANLIGRPDCFECGTYEGDGHCWVRFEDGEIWDLTATQFGKNRKIYITSSDKNYETELRGRKAYLTLSDWADAKWRVRLRKAVQTALEE